ncbi:uncharacterized protein [Argopecten irradians]|uniref:uncharacterized protein n=1 Tax=Argopecten irradians TaxID=31199 RepID=UPI003718EDBE
MASKNLVTLEVTTPTMAGKTRIRVTESMANLLKSPQIEAAAKEALVLSIIKEQYSTQAHMEQQTGLQEQSKQSDRMTKEISEKANSSITTNDEEKCTQPSKCRDRSSLDQSHQTKTWTENEESLLVDLRHERSALFKTTRNHLSLWQEIANIINETLNCSTTSQQVMYKYNALKKRWKEIIDSPSGSAAKRFTHKRAFDDEYGDKVSSRPIFTVDTLKERSDDSTESKNSKKLPKKTEKRKSSNLQVLSALEDQHSEFMQKIGEMHNERMKRFDRFLDIMDKQSTSDQ